MILDNSECCPLGLLKFQFSPERVLRFPLCSFFHPFVISVFPPLAMPNMWRCDCGRMTCQISRAFVFQFFFFCLLCLSFDFSLFLSTSLSYHFGFELILPPVIFSVSTLHIVVSFFIVVFFHFYFPPLLIPTPWLLSSPATCSQQCFALDMPRHVRTHAERRQTET